MNKKQIKAICQEIMDIFQGLMCGSIDYTPDRMDCAMGRCIGEVFDAVVGDFYLKVDNGHNVSNDELQELRDNLSSFNETCDVKEVVQLIEHIEKVLKAES